MIYVLTKGTHLLNCGSTTNRNTTDALCTWQQTNVDISHSLLHLIKIGFFQSRIGQSNASFNSQKNISPKMLPNQGWETKHLVPQTRRKEFRSKSATNSSYCIGQTFRINSRMQFFKAKYNRQRHQTNNFTNALPIVCKHFNAQEKILWRNIQKYETIQSPF